MQRHFCIAVLILSLCWLSGCSSGLARPMPKPKLITLPAAEAPQVIQRNKLTTQLLLKTTQSWSERQYIYPAGIPELSLERVNIARKNTIDMKAHSMPNIIFVVKGSVNVESGDGRRKAKLATGDCLAGMANEPYSLSTGFSPAELVIFYAGSQDQFRDFPVPPE